MAPDPIVYTVRRSPKARRVLLSVHRERGVEVVLPRGVRMTPAEIERLVEGRRDWIETSLDRLRARPAPAPPRRFEELPSVLFRGVECALIVREGTPAIQRRGDAIEITTSRPSYAVHLFEAWARWHARSTFVEALDRWERRLGVRRTGLTVGDARTRWGSCSAKKRITLSWRLMLAPPEVLDYVALHEVAHLVNHNHSPAYWAVVTAEYPEYRARIDWLREHGGRLRFE